MLTDEMKTLIAAFPLGFVATVTSEGAPAVSPKGTFLILDDQTIAFGDIRSPGTRANLSHDPRTEINFIDPFRRKAVRVRGAASLHPKGTETYAALHPRWVDAFGPLSRRIGAIVKIALAEASEIWTPPYDDGVTEDEMVALYKSKYGAMFP